MLDSFSDAYGFVGVLEKQQSFLNSALFKSLKMV